MRGNLITYHFARLLTPIGYDLPICNKRYQYLSGKLNGPSSCSGTVVVMQLHDEFNSPWSHHHICTAKKTESTKSSKCQTIKKPALFYLLKSLIKKTKRQSNGTSYSEPRVNKILQSFYKIACLLLSRI